MKKTVGFAQEKEAVEMTDRKEKKNKPPVNTGKNPEHERHYWVANVRQNIKAFFKLNAPNKLKREGLVADPDEQKETRGWLFFFIVVQMVVLVIYGFLLYFVDQSDAFKTAAILTLIPFGVRLISLLLFFLERIFTGSCFRRFKSFDPENPTSEYREVILCIPVFHEAKTTLERTIRSIGASKYPKNKLYMFFIVDGNKSNTYETLLELLRGEKLKTNTVIVPNVNNVEHGVYKTQDQDEIYYSVFLKNENRGLRDSKWLFVEVLRNMNPDIRPHFTMFLDSDTSVDSDAIRALQFVLNTDVEKHGDSFEDPRKRRGAVAGVTGKVKFGNFGAVKVHDSKWDNLLFNISNFGLLSVQYYHYNWTDVFSKKVEEAYSAVTCLPGAFSMFRTDILCDFDNSGVTYMRERDPNAPKGDMKEIAENEWVMVKKVPDSIDINNKSDYFAKPLYGFVQRVTQELGQDRHLTVRMLEKGFYTRYEPRAVAYSEGPETLSNLLQQHKRWHNSEFLNDISMFFNWRVWIRVRTLPIQLLALFEVVGNYLLPVNAILVTYVVWTNFIRWANETFDIELTTALIVFWWVVIQVVVMITTKLNTSDMFYALLTFFTGVMMVASIYFFFNYILIPIGEDFSSKPERHWGEFVLVIVWPVMHIVVSLFNPLVFFMGIATYIFFPTLTFTFSVYSFFALDDVSWGTR